jgi:U32 family peptidase
MMQLTTYVENVEQLKLYQAYGIHSAIIGHRELSRYRGLNSVEFNHLCGQARAHNFSLSLEWDILMTEDDFETAVQTFKKLDLSYFSSIRVQDPGALEYVLEHTQLPVELILENGNHNLLAVQSWIKYIGPRLKKVVLGIELPHSTLATWLPQISVDCEILVLGRILLFYTPRKLLSPLTVENADKNQDVIEAIGSSEESPHKGFPLEETKHGTFMFHIKDFCVLDHLQDLAQLNLASFRIDMRWLDYSNFKDIFMLLKNQNNLNDAEMTKLKELWPQDLMKGFYRVNKTDVLFEKLKNKRLNKNEDLYLGLVLENYKKRGMVVQFKSSKHVLSVGTKVQIMTPQGDEFELEIEWIENSRGVRLQEISGEMVVLMNSRNGILSRSVIHLC